MKLSHIVLLPAVEVFGAEPTTYFKNADFTSTSAFGPSGIDCTLGSAQHICMASSTPTVEAPGRTAWAAAPISNAKDWTTFNADSIVFTQEGIAAATCTAETVPGCAYHPIFIDKPLAGTPYLGLIQILPANEAGTGKNTNCLFQWSIGSGKGVKSTASPMASIQDCQTACWGTTDIPDCAVWTYTQTSKAAGECYLYPPTIWDALQSPPSTTGTPTGECTYTTIDGDNVAWATCDTDPTIKICARLDGASVSGLRVCSDPTLTPTLPWLQANATSVCSPTTPTTSPVTTISPTASTSAMEVVTTSGGSNGDITTGASSDAKTRISLVGCAAGVAVMTLIF